MDNQIVLLSFILFKKNSFSFFMSCHRRKEWFLNVWLALTFGGVSYYLVIIYKLLQPDVKGFTLILDVSLGYT